MDTKVICNDFVFQIVTAACPIGRHGAPARRPVGQGHRQGPAPVTTPRGRGRGRIVQGHCQSLKPVTPTSVLVSVRLNDSNHTHSIIQSISACLSDSNHTHSILQLPNTCIDIK